MLPEQQQRILGYFIEEARDHLNTIEQGLLNLQATLNDQEMINEVFRAAHSIKGGAAMLGLNSIQRTSHRLEDCFKILKDNPIQVDQKLESLFLGVSDTLKVLLEHLSGPFGLSEEAANNLMSEAEPVFGWLYEHLELLVGQQSGIAINREPEQSQEIASTSDYDIVEEDSPRQIADNSQYFQNQILHKLRDMLQLFKQPATAESRQDLKACCESLATVGEEFGLKNWCKLCRATGTAIANPDNSYLMLAKIVITDIKQAQELAIAGRDAEIAISHHLEALVDVPEVELFEFDNDFLDEIAITDNQDEYNFADFQLEDNFNITANFTDNNTSELESINSLFELSEEIESNTEIHAFDIEDEDDSINSLFELSQEVSVKVQASNAISNNINSSELSDKIDDVDEISVTQTDITLDPNGPEVGIAELSELDELFKIDAPELADTWEEKQPDIITTDDINPEGINTEDENVDSLVEDLLEFEDSTSFHERQTINPHELTIVQLFGDFLDDDLEVEETPVKNSESSKGVVGTNILSDRLANVDISTEDLFDIPLTTALDVDNDILDINATDIPLTTALDVDNDILDINATDILLSTALNLDNDILTANDEKIPSIAPDLELSTHEDAHLDSLFLEAENSVDAVLLVEEQPAEEMTIGNPETTTPIPEYLTFDSSSLLGSGEDTTSLSAASALDDLFDSSPTSLAQSSDDFNNFWIQEESEEKIEVEVNENIGQALEESLFAAASSNNIFDTSEDTELEASDSFADDFDINFNKIDSLFDLDDEDDLFGLTSTKDSVFSLSDDAEHNNELTNYSQQIEAPEFTPESLQNQLGAQLPQLKVGEEIELSHVGVGDDTLLVAFGEVQDVIADNALVESTFNDANNPFVTDVETIPQAASEATSATGFDFIDDLFGENTDLPVDVDELSPVTTSDTELPAFAETTVQTFDSEFEDNFFADGLSIDEIESLGAILEPFESFEQSIVPTSSISVDTNLETASTTNEVEEPEDEFAHLEALLNTNTNVKSANDLIADNEFAALEALLGDDDIPVTPAQIIPSATVPTAIPAMVDEFGDLERLLVDADISLSPGSGGSAKNQRPARRTARFEQLMKVPVKHLDELSNLVGELVVNRNTLEQDQERLRQSLDNLLIQVHHLSDVGARMQELYERSLLEASLLASRKGGYSVASSGGGGYSGGSDSDRGFSELEMDRFTPFHSLSQEMIELIVRVRESASDIDFVTEETERVARQFRQVTTQLQEGLTRTRMVPFSQVTDRVKRGVRDNAIKCGKQVELEIEGQDTLIDKMILEHLTDPLVHMLNNAIAHGIEMPEERLGKGKQPVGAITVRAFHQGNQTVISVSDDGAGIDHERVKQKALKVGLISPEQAKTISRIEVYELLFQPNFSTKDKADDLAGRGVGMDVVRTSISEIRGTITTDSKLGKGTNFTIRLPLTLSICKALCCVSDKARIAFPMDGVEDTLDIPGKNVLKNSEGESFISWRDTQLPFKPLKELLTLNRQLSRGSVYGGNRDDDMVSVVVVRSGNTLIALQVDQVLSEQEIVIKQFEGPAPKPIGVAGATVLGDGRIMPIADVLEIIDVFQGRTSKQSAVSIFDTPNNGVDNTASKIDPTVLIVDDSITVRELLSLTFNKAGYRVEQARDGQEAWDKLRSGLPCDIVFCDIEMPRCDGLELLSRISKEPNLNHLPIAMLTSRGADKHKQMAINLGASGYFTKPYLEEALLEAASRMLKGEKLISNATNS
jgi:chemotaxis protein histidine kinase CheA/ActR/RegA family two-component response regulator